jgi:hypothetical protein
MRNLTVHRPVNDDYDNDDENGDNLIKVSLLACKLQ